MADRVPDSYDAAIATKARDRLWCQAACEVLDIADIAKLTRRVNELRGEKYVCEPPHGGSKSC